MYFNDTQVKQLSKKTQESKLMNITSKFDTSPKQTNNFQIEEKSIANGNLDDKVDNASSREMEWTTKNNTATTQMIYSGFDNKNIFSVFKELEQGRKCSGFPTNPNQTTGYCSHLTSRVIYTVCIYKYFFT